MNPTRLRSFARLIGYVARRRQAAAAAARRPSVYVPTSPAAIAALIAEERMWADARLYRREPNCHTA